MKPETLKLFAAELAQVLREHVERELKPVEQHLRDTLTRLDRQNEKIEQLERRLAELEAKGSEPATRHLRAL